MIKVFRNILAVNTKNFIRKMGDSVTAESLTNISASEECNTLKRKADNDSPIVPNKIKQGKRKKIALLAVYSGKGYHGVQIQNDLPTIEGELFKALLKNEYIEQTQLDDVSQMWFQRASRTDKGVSAAGQVFSLLMRDDRPEVVKTLNMSLPDSIRILGLKRATRGFDAQHHCSHRTYEYLLPTFAFAPVEEQTNETYRITEKVVKDINAVLQTYKGTHNFFNFTSKRQSDDKSTMRYMISLTTGEPFVKDDIEYMTIVITGQSFMLHQIRKMIGLTIAIVRGLASMDIFNLCWAPSRVDIPKAPGLGLLLDKLYFDGYNKRFGNDGVHEPMEWPACTEEIQKFKMERIYADIMRTEKEEKSMFLWLQTLPKHTYQLDLKDKELRDRTDVQCEEKSTDVSSSENHLSNVNDGLGSADSLSLPDSAQNRAESAA